MLPPGVATFTNNYNFIFIRSQFKYHILECVHLRLSFFKIYECNSGVLIELVDVVEFKEPFVLYLTATNKTHGVLANANFKEEKNHSLEKPWMEISAPVAFNI